MLKRYFPETLITLTVAFMVWYPPEFGAIVLGLASAATLVYLWLQSLDRKKSPQLTKLETDVKELKVKVEQLVLRGNR